MGRHRGAIMSSPAYSMWPSELIPRCPHWVLACPKGIITGKHIEVTAEMIGDFKTRCIEMSGTGRDKIDNADKMSKCRQTCTDLALDGLIVVGGDDSNTNAAFLAENMRDIGVQVIGIPKTIDGDLQVPGLLQVPLATIRPA